MLFSTGLRYAHELEKLKAFVTEDGGEDLMWYFVGMKSTFSGYGPPKRPNHAKGDVRPKYAVAGYTPFLVRIVRDAASGVLRTASSPTAPAPT